MPVIKEIGFYNDPEKVGHVGWIETKAGCYFFGEDGVMKGPYQNGDEIPHDKDERPMVTFQCSQCKELGVPCRCSAAEAEVPPDRCPWSTGDTKAKWEPITP